MTLAGGNGRTKGGRGGEQTLRGKYEGRKWMDGRRQRMVTEYSMSVAITRAVLPETAAPIYGAPKHDADGLFFRRGFRGQKCTAAAGPEQGGIPSSKEGGRASRDVRRALTEL